MTTTAVPDVALHLLGLELQLGAPPRERDLLSAHLTRGHGGTEPGTGCRPGDARSSLCSPAPHVTKLLARPRPRGTLPWGQSSVIPLTA